MLSDPETFAGLEPLANRRLLMWELQSLRDHKSWGVFEEPDRFRVRLVRVYRTDNGVKNIGSETFFPVDAVAARLSQLHELRLRPFVGRHLIGLDGPTFSLRFGTGFASTTMSWWCDAPEEWRELEGVFHSLREDFEARLPWSGHL